MWKYYIGGKLESPRHPRNDVFGAIKVTWNKTAVNIRRRHLRKPDFADIIHFVDDEATLANDPLFSKEALSGFLDKKETPNWRKQRKIYLAAA